MDYVATVLDRVFDPSLIEAIAKLLWPVLLFTLALMYRKQLQALLRRLIRANLLGSEFSFSEIEKFSEQVTAVVENKEKEAAPVMTNVLPDREQTQQDRVVELRMRSLERYASSTLLDRPFNEFAAQQVRELAESDPAAAVLTGAARLEQSIREVLATRGIFAARSEPMRQLARKLQDQLNLSVEFARAVTRLLRYRNRIAQSLSLAPRDQTIQIAHSAADLIDLVQRLPRDILFIEEAGLPVFADPNQVMRLGEYEAVRILFAALPGQTGAVATYVTDRTEFYKVGMQVSSEWKPVTDFPECWTTHSSGEPQSLGQIESLFVGSPIFEGMDMRLEGQRERQSLGTMWAERHARHKNEL